MEFSSFDAPSLPPPDGEPARPTPAAPADLTRPTLPPPAGHSPDASSLAAPALPPPPAGTAPTPVAPTPPPAAATRPPRRSRRGLAVAAVAALAVGGVAVWQLTSGDDTDRSPGAAPSAAADELATDRAERAEPASSADETIGAIGADAIGEAEELVDQVDERSETGELLAELGLGPDGEPLVEAPVIADPAGYAFVWTDPTGDRVGALVDATDGDYAIEGSDGLAIRVVDGVPYTRADGEWTLTDLSVLGNRPVPALDGFPTIERVIHAGIAPYVRDTATTATEQGTTFAYLVDDSALFAADPASREAWLLPWGLRDGHRPPPVADPTELADARSDARPGQVVVAFTVSPSGELVTVTVASPAIGGVGVLDQIGTSAEPASIELSD